MTLKTLVWREIFERKNQLATGFLAILLGITAIVAIKNITVYSEKAVARELDALGANILILPKSATLQNYYSADMQGEVLPEDYVVKLTTSGLQGVDNLSPKLSVPVELSGHHFTLTGILPKNEFQAKAAWMGAGIFGRPQGCGTVVSIGNSNAAPAKETLVRKRVIETLGEREVLAGSEVAAALGLEQGKTIQVMGNAFTVSAVLPQTGTVDDSRIFAHLHTVQELAGTGSVINAIEVVGCCEQISKGLVQKINSLLPDAKVVTVMQVVGTQIKTNQMMTKLSVVFLVIIMLVGGASIANYMYANVYERRREIGTLIALGAGSRVVVSVFLLKASVLGIMGGFAGYILGTFAAMILGPKIAGVPVLPVPWLAAAAIGVALLISLGASFFPARKAAKLDPSTVLQEI